MECNFRHKRLATVIAGLCACTFFLVTCIENSPDNDLIVNSDGEAFAGSGACAGCHKNVYDTHIKTAHFLTSQVATASNIKGSFEPGKNVFEFGNDSKVEMEKVGGAFYQVEISHGKRIKNRRFDVVVGSGTKGQTYLNRRSHSLFQLPVSYFTATNEWTNSPGYPGKAVFGRPVTSRCLECHSTYAVTGADSNGPERFELNKIVYGVDCERCHGPAKKHVDYHLAHKGESLAKYIINPAKFSRQQSLDLCKLCHGGRLTKKAESFTFKPGQNLNDFFTNDNQSKEATDIDVHGNQYGLLAASKCFKGSTMTCVTCHDPHANEAGNVALFSKRCISCHSTGHSKVCKLSGITGNQINSNCIDCHMPQQPSKAIAVFRPGANSPTSVMLRTHWIKIYPAETGKLISLFKNK